jgi:2-keto-4-pentenoate hydratase/2-oxohepta-3-ene-1,7-dioic acid hydratase in catechol pathway
MRLATYIADAEPTYGLVINDTVIELLPEVNAVAGLAGKVATLVDFLGTGERGMAVAKHIASRRDRAPRSTQPIGSVHLMAPVLRPTKMLYVGQNYPDHVAEASGETRSKYPRIFAKFSTNIIGPGEPIILPTLSDKVDFEAELAVVIGRRARNVLPADALQYVAGLTIANDITARDMQFDEQQLTLGKNFRTFAPLGPVLVTLDELPDPPNLEIKCWVNGQLMQSSNTGKLIAPIPELISFLSTIMDLEPGDVISTGTPSGVGYFRNPPTFLEHGDVVRVEIDGIGTLENPVVGSAALPAPTQ